MPDLAGGTQFSRSQVRHGEVLQRDRIDSRAGPHGFEVQVRSGDAAGSARQADALVLAHSRAFMHVDSRKVHVDGEEPLAVIDDDAVAFVEEGAGEHHDP